MDVRKLGRWLGRLAVVAAFGAGAVLGVSWAAADEVGSPDPAVSEGAPVTTYTTEWD